MVESGTDVYTTTFFPGQDHSLGMFVYSGTPGTPPVRGSSFNSTVVNLGKTGTNGMYGTQGNSHLHEVGGIVQSVWTDDEYDGDSDTDEIAAYVLTSGSFPNGSWDKALLPAPINQPSPSREFQPFFTGTELFYTHASDTVNPEIFKSVFTGPHSKSGIETSSNWSTPQKIIGIGSSGLGTLAAAGEPTIATINGNQYLYFTYGYVRGYDGTSGLADINMQAGYIKKN